jgi:hypothetical protein
MRNRATPRKERRGPARPRNGDARPCASCGRRSEFSERYRLEGELVPAWVCDSAACREWRLVRQPASGGIPKTGEKLKRKK